MIVVETEQEMIAAGLKWSESLSSGQIIALVGELGAGKTHFTKGIVSGLGADDPVTSPTFALVNEYRSGRMPVFHFDFYRMDSVEELQTIGWEDYLYEENGLLIIEWADKFPDSLPEETVWCRFLIDQKSGSRTLIFD